MKEKSKQLQTFILSLMMLIMGAAGAWGETVTFTYSGSTVTPSQEGTGITSVSNGTATGYAQLGDGKYISVTAGTGKTITAVSVTYSRYATKTIFAIDGGGTTTTSWSVSGTTGTWEGTATSITITGNNDSGSDRISSVTVTYTTGGSTPTTTTLTVSPDEGSVYVGKTLDISGYVSTNSNATKTYTSSDGSVATVTSAGVISGVAAGSTTITVSQDANASYAAANATFSITVNAAPDQYTVNLPVVAGSGSVSAVYGTGGDPYNDKAAGATFTSGDKVSTGTVLVMTATPSTGYTWNRWSSGSSKTDNPLTFEITSAKNFQANFTAKTYTITLDRGTGGSSDGSATATYNSSALTSVTNATHATKTLTGYFTASSDGTKIINADGTLVARTTYTNSSSQWTYDGDVTLYAQWADPASYTITYVDANSKGTVPSATTGTSLTSAILSATPTSIASGYTFKEWCTDAALTTPAVEDAEIDEATTLYANYTMATPTVSPASASSIKAGDAMSLSSTPSFTKVYAGWTSSSSGIAQGTLTTGDTYKVYDSSSATSYNFTCPGSADSSPYFSYVISDGTFYSNVATASYTVGVATPVISCSSNTVTITCATTGASIYYTTTTDGSAPADPTSSSTLYTGSISIDRDTKVKAIAIKSATNSAVASENCSYTSFSWPVSLDFTTTPWSTSDNTALAGAEGARAVVHGVTFRGTSATEFKIIDDGSQHLQVNSNASTNHYFAIPLEQINGRIDIYVTAPCTATNYKVRSYLDTAHGTTVQLDSPSKPSAVTWSDYDISSSPGVYHYRIEDISATTGVLYLGVNSSSYKLIDKIRIETPGASLVPSQASVFMGDAEKDTCTVTITNYSTHRALLRTVPSYVNASFNPSTGELVITPKAIGTGENITLAVDTNDDGEADDDDLTIPVTVHGITIGTQPVSAVYKDGGAITALSVSATKTCGGTLAYQWYSNTVNSNTGGTAISGATSASYTPSLTAEANAFYYCVVSVASDTIKSKTSNVAYVLYSDSKRYFQMSNVAGNRQTSEASELITGEIIAGGTATAIYGGSSYYRYVNRPSTSVAHTYVANNSDSYFRIVLSQAIQSTDIATVLINDYGGSRGITISSADGTKTVTINAGSGSATSVNSYATSLANLAGETTLLVKGVYGGLSNYFTDLIFSEASELEVSSPTPASQSVQVGDRPATISVTATGSTGSYTYQWYSNTSASTSGATPLTGETNASYTPPTAAAAGTTYYYCLVSPQDTPTGYASVTVTALSHGYLTIDGTAHSGMTYSFTDNECKYLVNQANYNSQNIAVTDGANQKFWEIDRTDKFENKSINGITYTNTARIQKTGGNTYVNLYVKNATAFKVLAGNSSDRTYDIYVDGVKVGDAVAADPKNESPLFSLNSAGSKIEFKNPYDTSKKEATDVHIAYIVFYQKQPATLEVQENGETITEASLYADGGAKTYEVVSNSTGTITATSGTPGVATVSYSEGILTVTPVAAGTSVITINQDADATYSAASTTLTVTVKNHKILLSFSYAQSKFKGTALSSGSTIATGSLPVLTAKNDDGSDFTGTIYYHSDDRGIGYFGATKDTYASSDMGLSDVSNTTYSIKYGGGQGGARIYAYVLAAGNYDQAVAYFDLVVEDGTSNDIPKGKSPEIYEQYGMRNAAGEEVIRITYGGYKYEGTKTGKWSTGGSRGDYFVDGHEYYTRYGGLDAKDEYDHQLKGMSDDSDDMWYKKTETKPNGGNYVDFERVRPFNLPCRGSYIKFEPKKSGVLTAYVWQNGTIDESANTLGSKPRLGYWFDEDGWVQHPVGIPVTKQPLGVMKDQERKGRDGRNVDSQMTEKWTAAQGDQNMAKLLKYKYCKVALPDSTTAVSQFHENNTDSGWEEAYENPYYWGTNDEVGANLDQAVPKSMTPVPFHNGYLIPEAAYVKYTLDVVAGKSYYFYGMMTKIGYAGMNFVETDDVLTTSPNDIAHEGTTLHLQTDDDMTTYTFNGSVLSKSTVFDEVTLPSNYRKNKWNTICLPFALSENQVEEAFGVGTQLAIYNGLNHDRDNHVYHIKYLRHVDQNILPGQPYLIYPTGVDAGGEDLPNVDGIIGDNTIEGGGGTTRITFSTVLIDKDKLKQAFTSYGNDVDADGSTTSYIFTGSYKPTDIEKYDIYNTPKTGELKRYMGAGSSLNTYHALIKANDSNIKQDAVKFSFTEEDVEKSWEPTDDTPTEIVMVEDDGILEFRGNAAYSGKTYNMMGQEIDATSAKGMIIVDGKKYIK